MSTSFGARAAALGVVLLATVVTASSAFAQTGRVGDTYTPKAPDGSIIRFPGITYDAGNDAYLVTWTGFVTTNNHRVGARFLAADGTPLGQPDTVNVAPGGASRAACSAELNECLIVWTQEPTTIMGRLIRYSAGNIGYVTAPFVVNSNGLGKLSSAGPSVAYSATTMEFLVAWTDLVNVVDVRGQRVGGDGTLLGGEIPIGATGLWEGFPSITWNAQNNEFFVAYYQELSNGLSTVAGKRVQAGSGGILGGNTMYASVFEQYPEVAYNTRTNQYLAITWGFSGGSTWMLHGQLADANANPIGGVLPLAVNGGGDGVGLAYNSKTNTFFAVYLSQKNNEVWGVSVGPDGVPGAQFQVTVSGTKLATQPRVAGSTKDPRFIAVASNGYGSVMAQVVQDGPAAPVSRPWLTVDSPGSSVSIDHQLMIAGWTLDQGSSAGTGMDAVHVWAFPRSGGGPIFLGEVKSWVARGDVAAAFGDSRFTNVGFQLLATFNQPGVYDVGVYAHSTVTQTFNAVRTFTVTASSSLPVMSIDTPAANSSIAGQFQIGGWALDLGSPSTVGVDAVHIWAFPSQGGPFFVGAATLGLARPDVAAAFGSQRFTGSGYLAPVSLPSGDYDLAVYVHSSVSGTFNNVKVVHVHVN